MLYWLTQLLQSQYHTFRVFQYLTFRSILAALTALMVGLFCGPITIRWLKGLQMMVPKLICLKREHLRWAVCLF